MEIIQSALEKVEGFPNNVLNQVFTREDVKEMLSQDNYIDLIWNHRDRLFLSSEACPTDSLSYHTFFLH